MWRSPLAARCAPGSLRRAGTERRPAPTACSLSELGEVAVLAVDGTNLVAEAARRHNTAPTATAALGRTLMGGLLMGSFRKDDEAIQVRHAVVSW